ncbi:hypothetical protein [Arcanobacterium hippocoleae]
MITSKSGVKSAGLLKFAGLLKAAAAVDELAGDFPAAVMANLVPIFLAILPKLQDVLAVLCGKSAALAESRCKKLTSCFSFLACTLYRLYLSLSEIPDEHCELFTKYLQIVFVLLLIISGRKIFGGVRREIRKTPPKIKFAI